MNQFVISLDEDETAFYQDLADILEEPIEEILQKALIANCWIIVRKVIDAAEERQ